MNAHDILGLLAQRHARDMFWNEVKNGPTWGGSHMRLDALAIAKSWSPVRVYGYEIKVSRSDWIKDQKWMDYAEVCNYLCVVAAEGVVDPSEVPNGFGLLVPAKTGSMLRTIRKPIRREADPHWPTLLYLLMSRTRPDNGVHQLSREARVAHWREALEAKDAARKIGWLVRRRTAERIEQLERSAKRAEDLEELDSFLEANDPGNWGSVAERLERVRLAEFTKLVNARRALNRAAIRVARILGGQR